MTFATLEPVAVSDRPTPLTSVGDAVAVAERLRPADLRIDATFEPVAESEREAALMRVDTATEVAPRTNAPAFSVEAEEPADAETVFV